MDSDDEFEDEEEPLRCIYCEVLLTRLDDRFCQDCWEERLENAPVGR